MKANNFIFCIDELSNGCTGRKLSLENSVNLGNYSVWNEKRIKRAFSFGKGTEKDFQRYCKDNHIKAITEDEFISKFPQYYKKDIQYIKEQKNFCLNH